MVTATLQHTARHKRYEQCSLNRSIDHCSRTCTCTCMYLHVHTFMHITTSSKVREICIKYMYMYPLPLLKSLQPKLKNNYYNVVLNKNSGEHRLVNFHPHGIGPRILRSHTYHKNYHYLHLHVHVATPLSISPSLFLLSHSLLPPPLLSLSYFLSLPCSSPFLLSSLTAFLDWTNT